MFLISSFIDIVKKVGMILWLLLNLLRLFFWWSIIRSILENIPCILENNVYSASIGWNVLYLSIKFICSIPIFFVDFLSRQSIHCWKWGIEVPTIILLLPISLLRCYIYLMYFGAWYNSSFWEMQYGLIELELVYKGGL